MCVRLKQLKNSMNDILEAGRKSPAKITKIIVDRSKCIGARSCVFMAPGVFAMDDKNLVYIVDADASDDEMLRLSAQSCPVHAIELFGENGEKVFPLE